MLAHVKKKKKKKKKKLGKSHWDLMGKRRRSEGVSVLFLASPQKKQQKSYFFLIKTSNFYPS
jgi:hypothetical protein